MKIGQRVRSAFAHTDHDRWVGYVVGLESWEDSRGRTDWVHVRWIEPDGEVQEQAKKHEPFELAAISSCSSPSPEVAAVHSA